MAEAVLNTLGGGRFRAFSAGSHPSGREHPLTLEVLAHWSIPDPAAAEGTDAEKRRAFRDALRLLARRVQRFTSLPFESVDKDALRGSIEEIGAD